MMGKGGAGFIQLILYILSIHVEITLEAPRSRAGDFTTDLH